MPVTRAEQVSPKSLVLYGVGTLILVGVVVIPWSLALLSNSRGAPDDAAFVRMAFASVAGATIAIVTVVGLFLDRLVRRAAGSTIVTLGVLAVVVTLVQIQALVGAGNTLLQRLGLPT